MNVNKNAIYCNGNARKLQQKCSRKCNIPQLVYLTLKHQHHSCSAQNAINCGLGQPPHAAAASLSTGTELAASVLDVLLFSFSNTSSCSGCFFSGEQAQTTSVLLTTGCWWFCPFTPHPNAKPMISAAISGASAGILRFISYPTLGTWGLPHFCHDFLHFHCQRQTWRETNPHTYTHVFIHTWKNRIIWWSHLVPASPQLSPSFLANSVKLQLPKSGKNYRGICPPTAAGGNKKHKTLCDSVYCYHYHWILRAVRYLESSRADSCWLAETPHIMQAERLASCSELTSFSVPPLLLWWSPEATKNNLRFHIE